MLGERRTETGSLLPCDLKLAGPVISPSLWDNGLGRSSWFPELPSPTRPMEGQRAQCAVWLLYVCVYVCVLSSCDCRYYCHKLFFKTYDVKWILKAESEIQLTVKEHKSFHSGVIFLNKKKVFDKYPQFSEASGALESSLTWPITPFSRHL